MEDIMTIKKVLKKLMIFLLGICLTGCSINEAPLIDRLTDYAKKHNCFSMEEVWDFSWDIVYIDTRPYEAGNHIKTKYGIDFEVEPIMTEEIYRLLFFKDNKFIKEIPYEMLYIKFSQDLEYLFPTSTICATWNSDKLFLDIE